MNRNKILVLVFVVLLAASGLLLYKAFNQGSLLSSFQPNSVSDQDITIRNEADSIESTIQKAMLKIKNGGTLDELLQGNQYKALSDAAATPVTIGEFGRKNPFLPVLYPKGR